MYKRMRFILISIEMIQDCIFFIIYKALTLNSFANKQINK